MSNNKQSSVEWLVNHIKNNISDDGEIYINWLYDGTIEKAKAMHKEEIKEAYWNGSDGIETKTEILKVAEQYYNETFGGNNETA